MKISESMVDITYGKALFKAAQGIEKVDEILEEIVAIDNLLRQKKEYFLMLNNPTIEKALKKQLIRELLEGKITKELLNFILILIDKRRIGCFEGITRQYQKAVAASKDLLEGKVVSAVLLDEKQLVDIQKNVSALMKKNIVLVNKIDPSIIGGVKVFVEDKVIDATVKTRLKAMKDSLHAASV